jgi:uncharacterized protein
MRYLLIVSLLVCSTLSFAQKKMQAPPYIRPKPVLNKTVNDFGEFLHLSERQELEKEFTSYQARTGNAIVFISLDSLTDARTNDKYTIEETAMLYFNRWGIGDRNKNNGVLLMVSRSPRKVRIQVGRGIEELLSDQSCQEIVDNNLVPKFKQGLFYQGIKDAVAAIELKLDHQPIVDQAQTISGSEAPASTENKAAAHTNRPPPSALEIIGWLLFLLGSVTGIIYLLIKLIKMVRVRGLYSGRGYFPRGNYIRNSFNNYNSNNFSSGNNMGGGNYGRGGGSSSSSSSSGGSYGGGGSNGGGASGSW